MENERLWCYGLDKKGKFYGNEIYDLTERWEAIEKGCELAQHEGKISFYIGRVNSGVIEDVEKIYVEEVA